jgi:hypothetical protein
VVFSFIVACGGSGEPAGESPPPHTGAPGTVPQDFPEDFPAYPEADVVASRFIVGNYYVLWATEDDPSSVATFYEDALAQGRWQMIEKSESDTDARVIFEFKADDVAGEGIVSIAERTGDEARTEISVRLPWMGDGE